MTQPPARPGDTPTPRPAAGVASPCTNVCRMNAVTGYCDGCLRTIDEIVAWTRLDDAGRHAVLAQLPARREALHPPG